jgi:predicted RNA methylase
MPTVEWADVPNNIELLEAFQPRQLIEGIPDQLALERFPSPTLLQPVDDELVERLDEWRDQALKTSAADAGVDEQLQSLFAKLFVLRTIEDRKLAEAVPPLRSALKSSESLNVDQLIRVFEAARQYIGSELFDSIHVDRIPEFVIAGVIRDLYVPRRIAGENFYDFAWIDSDVLGLAYEKYLSTVLHPAPKLPQLDLFHGSVREVERISVRRAGGVYYTPQYLTRYLAEKCIETFFDARDDGELPNIIDFACGSGSFLVAALDSLLKRLKALDPDRDWARELIDGHYLNGVDVDEKAVTVARLNLWNRLADEPNPLPLPNLSSVVVRGDGLDRGTWGELNRQYDVVLGNPPFLATSRVSNRHELEQKFQAAKGRYDFSYLFVEQAIEVTLPQGILGMVVPNRLFRNANGSVIRSRLTAEMDLLTVVDFQSNEVFQGTSAYIGCIVAQHQELMAEPAPTVQVVEVRKLPEQFIAGFLFDAEQGAGGPEIRVYEAQHPRGPSPWLLLSAEEKRAQVQLDEISVNLNEIAGIFQGIRTGANDVFLFSVVSEDEARAQVLNGLGDSAVLELDLLQPVVFGGEVLRYQKPEPTKYLLYPYVAGVAISEAELQRDYPLTFKYLTSYRDILASRTSVIASGLRWYELVRRRDIEWLSKPKLLIRDLAPETAFAPDPDGSIFLVGGTAVVPVSEDDLFPLLAYLNSRPVSELIRRTTPQFRGGFQKFEPRHLERVPVLRRLLDDRAFAEQLGELASRVSAPDLSVGEREALSAQIDEIIEQAFAAPGVEEAA